MSRPKNQTETIRYNPADNTFIGITEQDIKRWQQKYPDINIEEGIADAIGKIEGRIEEWKLAATLREPIDHLLAEKLKAFQKRIQGNPISFLEDSLSAKWGKPFEPENVHPLLLTAEELQAKRADIASTKQNGLTDTESNMLEALGDSILHGPALLKKAGYDNSSHYRAILSGLVKRNILDRNARGYHRKSAPSQ